MRHDGSVFHLNNCWYYRYKQLRISVSFEAAARPLSIAPSTFGLTQKSPQMASLSFTSQRHLSSFAMLAAGKALPLETNHLIDIFSSKSGKEESICSTTNAFYAISCTMSMSWYICITSTIQCISTGIPDLWVGWWAITMSS